MATSPQEILEEDRCPRCGTERADGPCPSCIASLILNGDPTAAEVCEPPPLRRLGNYDLLEEIARGGMGVVYRARQHGLNREVAVKVLRDHALARPEDRRRFRTEAEAIAKLNHTRIVAIHEIGEDDGLSYYAMDYVVGGNLAERTRNGPLPAREAASLAVQIADAVGHAHARGILHRDLKPSNVLLDAAGDACVTDFGLARPLDDASSPSLTLTGQVLGTPGYMPPEQATGRKNIGPAADIYALGALLYHLLTGRPPFAGATVGDTLRQVLEQEPVSPRLLNAQVPADLASVCLRCLAKEERGRYPTAEALAADLRRFLRGEPTFARPAGPTERSIRWIRRKPALAGLAFLALLIALLGIAGIAWQWRRAEASRARAEANALAARHQVYATDMLGVQQALDLGNVGRAVDQLVAYEPRRGEPDFRGWEWWFFAKRCLRWIDSHPGPLGTNPPSRSGDLEKPAQPALPSTTPPVFSPDSTRIAFADAQGWVNLWDPSRHQVVSRIQAGPNPIGFSPDGTTLVTAAVPTPLPVEPGPFGGLEFWDVRSGSRLRAWSPETTNEITSAAAISTDGRWLATGDPAGRVSLRSAEDGRPFRELTDTKERVWNLVFSPDNRAIAVALDSGLILWWPDSGQTRNFWGTGPPVAFSPDGRLIAIGFYRQVRIYDVASGTLRHGFFLDQLSWLGFSHDGKTLACADGSVSLWNVATERRLATFGPRSGAEFVRFSPDGSTLIGGKRGEMHLWEAANPREVERLFNNSVPSYTAALPPRDPSRVPPRAAHAERRWIDLSGFYSASLDDNWGGSPGDHDDNSLRELTPGIRTLAGVPFDVRGILQLGSLHGYPRKIRSIPIGMKCKALHFLQGATWGVDPPGTQVGRYIVNYADGGSEEIPLILGRTTADWTMPAHAVVPEALSIAWDGSNESGRSLGLRKRLFKLTWTNPCPNSEIRTLDFAWAAAQTEPFLVAVTAE